MLSSASVVVTCHNLEKYIGAAIESVLAQDYSGAVELIVVDDCSTDRSLDFIRAYPSVRLLSTPANSGVLVATVLGIREASHDAVFFLDGDDLWHPHKLRLAMECFAASPSMGLLTHDLDYIDGSGDSLPKTSRPSQVMYGSPDDSHRLVRDGILQHLDYVWLGSAYAIRRSRVDAAGFCDWAMQLPDAFNTYQDWPLAFWAASRPDARMGYLSDKLFHYRLHGANHSGDSRNTEKALRNVKRTCNTMQAMSDIALASSLEEPVMRATSRKLRYYRYVLDLYSGRRFAAFRGLVANLPYLFSSTEKPSKEILRFLGVQMLGLRRFLSMAGRLAAKDAS